MNQVLKNSLATLLSAACLLPAFAQEKEKSENKKVDQIIITNRGDKKMTIVVDGEKITVNGKDVKELKDDEVTVRKFSVNDRHVRVMATPAPGMFEFNNENFSFFNEDENKAMLGVITERVEDGAKINQVNKESAAEKAGLKTGDVITKIGDKKVSDPDELSKAIQTHKPGEKVKVTYLRDKKSQTADVELGKWRGVRMNAFSYSPSMAAPDVRMLEDLGPHLRSIPRINGQGLTWSMDRPRLGLSIQDTEDGKGVKVIDVDDEGNAAKSGIEEGDIILEVDGKAVNSADQISSLIRENREKVSMMMKLTRNGKTHNVEVKMPRKLKTADL